MGDRITETHTREIDGAHRRYFDAQAESNIEFWRRFKRRPNVAGIHVLDLGCGHGAVSIELARRGATVVGLDLSVDLIEWGTRNLQERHNELASRVKFVVQDVMELPGQEIFDLVVCKDTFEHVADVGNTLRAVHRLLKPGGELWTGFSPMYYSPWGDHSRTGIHLPWGHALLPRRFVYAMASRHNKRPVDSLEDIGLNGMTARDFRRHIRSSGFQVESIAYNRGDRPLLKVFAALRKVPVLEAFTTVSIYGVFQKVP